jgi:hypothetical protein
MISVLIGVLIIVVVGDEGKPNAAIVWSYITRFA